MKELLNTPNQTAFAQTMTFKVPILKENPSRTQSLAGVGSTETTGVCQLFTAYQNNVSKDNTRGQTTYFDQLWCGRALTRLLKHTNLSALKMAELWRERTGNCTSLKRFRNILTQVKQFEKNDELWKLMESINDTKFRTCIRAKVIEHSVSLFFINCFPSLLIVCVGP